MSKWLGRDISVRQHCKSEHWAPCHILTPSGYDCKRLKATLTLSTLGKIFSRRRFEIFFLFFPRKQDLTFHANYLLRRQFAWNVKSCFPGKIRKISSICQRVVKVKPKSKRIKQIGQVWWDFIVPQILRVNMVTAGLPYLL